MKPLTSINADDPACRKLSRLMRGLQNRHKTFKTPSLLVLSHGRTGGGKKHVSAKRNKTVKNNAEGEKGVELAALT